MQSLEDLTRGWPGAVIAINEGEETTFRLAAFVFEVRDGIAWVEPSYADPAGAGTHALHIRRGTWRALGVLAADRWELQVLPFVPVDADMLGDGLVWFAGWLKAQGRTWAEERERVRAMLADSLA